MHTDLKRQLEQDMAEFRRRLRALPSEARPPFDWNELQRRRALCAGRDPRTRLFSPAGAHFAGLRKSVVAASLVAVLAGLGLWSRYAMNDDNAAQPSSDERRASTESAVTSFPPAEQRLAKQLRASETWLAHLPPEPAVVSVGTHLAVTDLEDRIASLDDRLSVERIDGAQPSRVLALQQQRAQLVYSLAQVRYAERLAAGLP